LLKGALAGALGGKKEDHLRQQGVPSVVNRCFRKCRIIIRNGVREKQFLSDFIRGGRMRRKYWLFVLILTAFCSVFFSSSYKGLSFEEWLQVLNNGNIEEKQVALEAMGYLYEPEIEELLLSYLEHENKELKLTAAWSLGQMKSIVAVERIVWLTSYENDVRIDGALVNYGPIAIPFLITKLKLTGIMQSFDQGLRVSRIIIDINSTEGIAEVASFLTTLLSSESYKSKAVNMLSQIGNKAIDPLLLAFQKSYTDDVKLNILNTLVTIADPKVLPILYTQSNSGNPVMRRTVANALGRIKAPENVPYLITLLRDPDENVKLQAVIALGELKDTSATVYLINLLSDPNAVIKAFSAYALGEIKDVRAVYPLFALLTDTTLLKSVDPKTGKTIEMAVYKFAVEALQKINDPRGLDELKRRGLDK
jgi:HEAT repeat protein